MHKLNPKVILLFFFHYLILLSIIPVFFLFYLLSLIPRGEIVGVAFFSKLFLLFAVIVVGWIVVAFVLAWLTRRGYSYTLTDTYFQKKSGIFRQKGTTIPYEMIKHIDTARGVLARLLGLMEIRIETGERRPKNEGRVPGLSKDRAEQLKDELLRRAHKAKAKSD